MTGWSPTRRQFLGAVGVSGVSPAGIGGTPVAGIGNVSWKNATDGVPDHPFVPEAEVAWSVATGDDNGLLRKSETDGVLYLGTPTGVHCFSIDGTERWRRQIESGDPDFPVEVYPGTGAVYAEGRDGLYALDAVDGHAQWRSAGDSGIGRGHVDVSLVTPETVFLHEQGITALAASDGRERWRFEPDDSVWFKPHFDGDYFYTGTIQGHLYALDVLDGSVRWHADRSSVSDPPRLSVIGSNDGTVFAWDYVSGKLYAHDRIDGSLRWQLDANGVEHSGFPGVVRSDVVYLGDGSFVRAISTDDGTERWRYEAGSTVLRWPKVSNRVGYFGVVGGVHAISTIDGTQKWRFYTGSEQAAYVTSVDEGTVIVDSREDAIYALDAETGRLQWRFGYPGQPMWLPQTIDTTTYFSTESGTVYALSSPNSTPLYDALGAITSPTGLVAGGLFGAALAVGAYRRHNRDDSGTPDPTTFADFEVLDALAESDHAEVRDARTSDGERVALMQIESGAIAPGKFTEAVQTWTDLDARGVLGVREWGTDPVPWVATDPVDASLADRAGDLTTAELGHALADVAETLHRAHRVEVAHGRLEPESIWFADGDVRVADWGIAAELREESDDSDARKLAVMARDLLADRQASDRLDDVLTRALADDPADRYDSLLKFADALRWAASDNR